MSRFTRVLRADPALWVTSIFGYGSKSWKADVQVKMVDASIARCLSVPIIDNNDDDDDDEISNSA